MKNLIIFVFLVVFAIGLVTSVPIRPPPPLECQLPPKCQRIEPPIPRKDKEISSLIAKLDDEQSLVRKLQKQINELQSRIEELEEEVEAERQARANAEIQRAESFRLKDVYEEGQEQLEAVRHGNKNLADEVKELLDQIGEGQQLKDLQSAFEKEQRAHDDAREQLGISERRANALQNELEESRTLLEQADRGRRQAEQELSDPHEQLNEIADQNASISVAKKKLESELQTLHSDLDELLKEAENFEEKAKVDTTRLADELRAELEHLGRQNQGIAIH